MSATSKLGVGLIGAHTWADKAHLPGYTAHERVDLVAVCDIDPDRARAMADKYGARRVYTDPQQLIADPDVQMVDVCTPTHTHLPLSLAAIAGKKHVLSEKPLHTLAEPAFDAARRADAAGVRTKLGFTFRYSPAIRQIKRWIDDGTLGEIFHIQGFEQNSQWLDPDFPLRQVAPDAVRDKLIPSSIIGYGSHLIDLMRWLGGEFKSVASTMKNFIPDRVIRGEPGRQRVLVEDGAVAIVEYANGTQGMLQTSYIAVGNYPGVEIRVYGSKGAAVARLVDEFGVAETLKFAQAESVEFKPVAIGVEALPPGTTLGTPWPELYYRNLVRFFVDEILEDRPQECTFFDGAKSQEIVDAIITAHYERRWVDLPVSPLMASYAPALVDRFLAHYWHYHPVDATFMGDRAHDHLLPPVGSAVVTEEKAGLAALLRDVAATDEPVDLGQRLDRRMMLAELAVQAAQAEHRHRFGNPAWFTGEAAFGVISLLLPQSAPIRHDALLARLGAIPGFLRDGAEVLVDWAVPKGWTARAGREAAAMAEFLRTDIRLHEDFADDWAAPAARAAVALEQFAEAIAGLPDADPACGPAYLQMLLDTQHGFSLSPDEFLRKAEGAFAALGDEMDAMAARIAPDQSASAIIAGLSDDHSADAEAVIEAYLDWDVRAVVASDGLVTPAQDYDLDYRWMAPCFRKLSQSLYFLFYRSPPGLDAGAGSVYWVTPPGADSDAFLRGNSVATIKTIHAVHHGSVGHHTQNTRARAADSRLARIGGTDCAMGLAFLGVGTLIEGWACYVEDLLMEAPGFYTPAEMLLLKRYERRNAASVIVDIKLHLGEWSLTEAMAFYRDKAGFAPARVEAEVVRNSMFPSSRLMYWAGVEGIKLLRKRFTGTTAEFHDTLLSFGHMPLAWIGEELARAGRLGVTGAPLLEIRNLVTEFRTETGIVRAVKGVDLSIAAGQTVAVVGESGSGKSVTSLSVMRLIPKAIGGIAGGEVLFRGRDGTVRDLAQLPEGEMRKVRGNEISMIFQEPMTSLNPTQKVGAQIAEAAQLHQGLTGAQAWRRAVDMLTLVEIPEPARRAQIYPHQMSGGMRQRVMIAMALACNPALLIADEPTTALDVTVQLQILDLMRRLQREIGMGILFITHNLGVVAEIADRVAVMYGGRIVESASVEDLFDRPSHPYTRGLLASMPTVDRAARAAGTVARLTAIPGSVVDPRHPPAGCDFNPRCAWAIDACRAAVPPMLDAGNGHGTRCIRWSELDG